MRTRRWAIAGLGLALLAGAGTAFVGWHSDRADDAGGIGVGRAAPAFSAPIARQQGGTFSLEGQRGHAVLVSFLNTQAQPSKAGDPSRSQIVFLKSMNTQNHPDGLKTVIVDAAAAAGVPAPSHNDLINFTFNWALAPSISVIGDASGSIERTYGITKLPTTLAIDEHGIVRHRWNGFALAAELDFAVRPLVGRPLAGSSTSP